jgi:FG-GAP-like repeat
MATELFTFNKTVNLAIPASGTSGTVSDSVNFNFSSWGRIADLLVVLFDLTHAFPDDLDFLLVGPGGTNFEFWSDAGGGTDITNGDFTISDSAASALPDATALASGTYGPADYGTVETGDNWGLASSLVVNHPGTATFNSAFAGKFVSGAWSIYITDDLSGDVGSLGKWGFTVIYNIIVKTDDFNNSGRSDILWRNDSGQVYFWNMNGSAIQSEGSAAHAVVPNDWHIQGTGDFDGDEWSDILWRPDWSAPRGVDRWGT